MASIKGLGVRWGVSGVTFTAGIVSTSNEQQIQSVNINRICDTQEIRDGAGDTVGKVFYNQKRELSISVIPSHASTIAGARTSLDNHMIPPGTLVTIVDTEGASIDASNGGKFNLISARQGLTNTGVAVVDLELEQFTAHDMTDP